MTRLTRSRSDFSSGKSRALGPQMAREERAHALLVECGVSVPALIVTGVLDQPQRILGAGRAPQQSRLFGREAIVEHAVDEEYRPVHQRGARPQRIDVGGIAPGRGAEHRAQDGGARMTWQSRPSLARFLEREPSTRERTVRDD